MFVVGFVYTFGSQKQVLGCYLLMSAAIDAAVCTWPSSGYRLFLAVGHATWRCMVLH